MPAPELEEDSVDLTPMIDVVFLLLIFFMVSMRIVQEESEIIVPLPSKAESSEQPDIPPQNVRIEIARQGLVTADGLQKDATKVQGPDPLIPPRYPSNMPELTNHILQQGQFGFKNKVKIIVNIKPDGFSSHNRTMSVLNALTKANKELEKMGVPPDKLLTQILFE